MLIYVCRLRFNTNQLDSDPPGEGERAENKKKKNKPQRDHGLLKHKILDFYGRKSESRMPWKKKNVQLAGWSWRMFSRDIANSSLPKHWHIVTSHDSILRNQDVPRSHRICPCG
jgi:hypothetical protein